MFQAEWTLVLGEQALDICVPSVSPSASSIFVLGERNLFCLRDNGQIRFMKKLEYNPSCFLPYASGNGTIQPVCARFPKLKSILVNFTPPSSPALRIGPKSSLLPKTKCPGKQIWLLKNTLLSRPETLAPFHGKLLLRLLLTEPVILNCSSRGNPLRSALIAYDSGPRASFLNVPGCFYLRNISGLSDKTCRLLRVLGLGARRAPKTGLLCVPVSGRERGNISGETPVSSIGLNFNTLRQPSGVNTSNRHTLFLFLNRRSCYTVHVTSL